MPSRRKPSLCIFGDSQMASLRRAVDAGLLDLSGYRVEYWGATGPLFRQIDMVDGVVRARGKALEMVRQVNGMGRDTLSAGDFDLFLFYGARLRVADFLAPVLSHQYHQQGWQSAAALRAAASFFLNYTRAWRMAAELAGAGSARVFYIPAPLPTAGVVDFTARGELLHEYPQADRGTPEDLARVWNALCAEADRVGVTLLPQPADTVVEGMFTDARYAVDTAAKYRDHGHKSPEFAALVMNVFLQQAAQRQEAGVASRKRA